MQWESDNQTPNYWKHLIYRHFYIYYCNGTCHVISWSIQLMGQ